MYHQRLQLGAASSSSVFRFEHSCPRPFSYVEHQTMALPGNSYFSALQLSPCYALLVHYHTNVSKLGMRAQNRSESRVALSAKLSNFEGRTKGCLHFIRIDIEDSFIFLSKVPIKHRITDSRSYTPGKSALSPRRPRGQIKRGPTIGSSVCDSLTILPSPSAS